MKKQILNIGRALNKAEQKKITGGFTGGLGCNRAEYPLVTHCDNYANQSSCNADPSCLWGDWSWEGGCPSSCASPF